MPYRHERTVRILRCPFCHSKKGLVKMGSLIQAFFSNPVYFVSPVGLAVLFWWLHNFCNILNMNWIAALSMAALQGLFLNFAVMKLLAIIEAGGDLANAGNYRVYGALLLMPVFYYFGAKITKRNMSLVFDVFAVGMAINLFFGRMLCVFNGCCGGALICTTSTMRWPTRQLDLIYYVIFVAVYLKKVLAGKTYGQVYPMLLLSYGLSRFIIEWMREEYTTVIAGLHWAHIWSLLAIIIGAVTLYLASKRQKDVRRR